MGWCSTFLNDLAKDVLALLPVVHWAIPAAVLELDLALVDGQPHGPGYGGQYAWIVANQSTLLLAQGQVDGVGQCTVTGGGHYGIVDTVILVEGSMLLLLLHWLVAIQLVGRVTSNVPVINRKQTNESVQYGCGRRRRWGLIIDQLIGAANHCQGARELSYHSAFFHNELSSWSVECTRVCPGFSVYPIKIILI